MIIALMYLGNYHSMSETIMNAVAHELEDIGEYKYAKQQLAKEKRDHVNDKRFEEFL